MIGDYTFFTADRMNELWNDCRVLLKVISPEILMLIALYAFYRVALMIRKTFFPEPDDEDKYQYDYNEEEDY